MPVILCQAQTYRNWDQNTVFFRAYQRLSLHEGMSNSRSGKEHLFYNVISTVPLVIFIIIIMCVCSPELMTDMFT